MRLAAAILAVSFVSFAGARPCAACSCVVGDPRDMVRAADAAFVGLLLEKRPKGLRGPIRSSGDTFVYTFRVEEELKGRLGQTVDVESAESSASCGVEARVGARTGLVLRRSGGAWTSSLCQQVVPAQLRAAARPLPRPNGVGGAEIVVGGSFGEARTIALDARGRTIAYAFGRGDTVALAVCPGRRRVVELVAADANTPAGRSAVVLAVRTLPRLKLVRAAPVPPRLLNLRKQEVRGFGCRDALGRDVLVLGRRVIEGVPGAAILFRARPGGFDVLDKSFAEAAAFVGRHAYLAEGRGARRLVSLDLRTKTRRPVATVPSGIHTLVASPDGRHVAAYVFASSRVVVVRLADGRVRTVRVAREVSADVVWTSASRFVFLPRSRQARALVVDAGGRVRARLPGWDAVLAVARGSRIYGVRSDGRVVARGSAGRTVRTLRTLPSPTAYAIG